MCSAHFLHQGPNGRQEHVDFLYNKEKTSSKSKVGIVVGVLVALLVLAAVAGFLIWLFVCKCSRELSSALSPPVTCDIREKS